MAYYDTPYDWVEAEVPGNEHHPRFDFYIPVVSDFPQHANPGELCCLGNRIYCCVGSRWIGVETDNRRPESA